MNWLGFHVKVYETRPDLNTLNDNQHADVVEILSSYHQIRPLLEHRLHDFIVVMTFGYRSDDEVIRALRDLPFEWMGLLGSQTKIDRMMEEYRREGFDDDWLKGISAPVGMAIKSQTPEEIAVSIAAEIIAWRNRNL
jgi:xanthine dehydrogenase accessory factor